MKSAVGNRLATGCDQELVREACYIDGAGAPPRRALRFRRRSGHRGGYRRRAEIRPRRDARGRRRRGRCLPRLASGDRERARGHPPPLVRPGDGQPGGPGARDDGRAGQAARRIARRSRVRRLVHRVVRRRGQARLRGHHSPPRARQAHRRHQRADRRRRMHYAVELPDRHDHAQGGPGDCGRLYRGDQTRVTDAVLGARASPCSPSARGLRACSTS